MIHSRHTPDVFDVIRDITQRNGWARVGRFPLVERIFHFRLSGSRGTRAVRVASDILLDVEPSGAVAGLWLLNVPPFPHDT